MTRFGALLLASFIITSCNNNLNNTKEETQTANALKTNIDSVKENLIVKSEPEKLEPANVVCSIFFKGRDFEDEDGGEPYIGTVVEQTEFKRKKTYTFCYDSEDFHHLTLNGKGKQLTFIINSDNNEMFKKENFDVAETFTFTDEDFNFSMGAVYSIILKQNEKILFKGKIDSQGCM